MPLKPRVSTRVLSTFGVALLVVASACSDTNLATAPAMKAPATAAFGKAVPGVIYASDFSTDPSLDGVWSGSAWATAPSGQLFNGLFSNATVGLDLGAPVHTSVTISFDVYAVGSWDGKAAPPNGPDSLIVTESSQSRALLVAEYNAWNPRGATATNTLGYMWGTTPLDATYHYDLTFRHSAPLLSFHFRGANLTDEQWGIDNVRVTYK
jgi:hypothetical protein